MIEGTFTGRLSPGLAWVSDSILQSETAFIASIYRMPVFTALWGWMNAQQYVGRKVRVHGWYRRLQAPVLEVSYFEVGGAGTSVWTYVKPMRFLGPFVMLAFALALVSVGLSV